MRTLTGLLTCLLLVTACGEINQTPLTEPVPPRESPTVRILLVGDVMTGRGVAGVLEANSDEVFAGVRHLLDAADIVGANLESPLTDEPHASANENILEADPATAASLAAAGFDLMSLPNNHSTDAGADGLVDTISAVEAAGMKTVGAGSTLSRAIAPIVISSDVSVGFLAFDATGVGAAAGVGPGVAVWNETEAVTAVRELRRQVDVVVVSVHGGTEYLPVSDPGMIDIAQALGAAGVDVVWGHGAHVVQTVRLVGAKPTVAATSLGNFLFDQSGPDRTSGAMLEVLAGPEGVVAYRVGMTEHADRRVEFVEWLAPERDAVWLHGSWWNLLKDTTVEPSTAVEIDEFGYGDLTAAAAGNATGEGAQDLIVSFRRPHQSTPLMELRPDVQWEDADGRSAHVGVYEPESLREIWVAGTVVMPVADLAVCDGAIATIHDRLDDPTIVAGGAWQWNGFGFDTAPELPGTGTPACADVNADGHTDPVIISRSS